MIYYVTNSQEIQENRHYKRISIESSIEFLKSLPIIGLDTETAGLDSHTKALLSVQMGNFDDQVVIDCSTVDIHKYECILLDRSKIFILCNAKFDLQFFYEKHIDIDNIWDVFLMERLLFLGLPYKEHPANLKYLSLKYCSVNMDKTARGQIIKTGINSDRVIVYAATDVKYLELIMNAQKIELKKKGLITAAAYENKYCPVLAYIEWCGVKLDVPRWKEKMKKDFTLLKEKEQTLNDWVIKNYPDDKRFTFIDRQGDLFTGFNTGPQCKINWNSPKQVIPFLEGLGFDLRTKDKNTGLYTKSVGAKTIKPQISKNSIAPVYIAYKEASKLVGTYGQNILDQINPATHRIHTNYNQLGTTTGRLSSGGKEGKIRKIDFQNIPAEDNTRACFIAEEGNKFVSCDYSGQESRVIAYLTKDPSMLDLYKNGCGDMHSLVAKMAYPDIIGDTPVEEIKAKFKKQRSDAKNIEFGFNYGGDAHTIHSTKGIPLKEAEIIYDNYMKGFPGVKDYQDRQRKFVIENGYVTLCYKTGHKSFMPDFRQFKDLEKKLDRTFWRKYRDIPRNPDTGKKKGRNEEEIEMTKDVSTFYKTKSSMEKQAIDYSCQGSGAVMHKLSSILFFKWIKDNHLLYKVKLVLAVHDELDFECPAEIADKAAKALQDFMYKAGDYLCGEPHFPADAEIGDYWIH